jgi:IS30 family transposase
MERKYHRVGFTAAQSAELWERWKKGEGLKAIGRVLGKPHSCIWAHLRPSGGIRPERLPMINQSFGDIRRGGA